MNTVDMILTQIGQPTDGLGPNWSPLERVVHKFHMKDLWATVKAEYDMMDQVWRLIQCNCIARTLQPSPCANANTIFFVVVSSIGMRM